MQEIKLEDGRKLGIEPVAPHEAMTIAEGCRELSGVRRWWDMAMTVAAVRMVDGIPLPAPTHEKHIEGLVSRFSRADLKAIGAALDVPREEHVPVLELAELTPIETLRLWALIGEFDAVPGWVAPAFIAAGVRSIDGAPVEFPRSRAAVKEILQRIGSGGMTEAALFLVAKRAEALAAQSDIEAAAKN